MPRALLLDDDPRFIIAAQKLFPKDTEWLATVDLAKADALVNLLVFDVIFVRKRNEGLLRELVSGQLLSSTNVQYKPLRQLIVLPRVFWRHRIKRVYQLCKKTI